MILETPTTLTTGPIPMASERRRPLELVRELQGPKSAKVTRCHQLPCPGKQSIRHLSPPTGTGETLTAPTTYPGVSTSIFHSTADHAGPTEPPPLLLIDSTLCFVILTRPQLALALKQSSTVKLVAAATVVTLQVFTTTLTTQVSPTPHAWSMRQRILMPTNVSQLISAETAHGLPHLRVRAALTAAGQ